MGGVKVKEDRRQGESGKGKGERKEITKTAVLLHS